MEEVDQTQALREGRGYPRASGKYLQLVEEMLSPSPEHHRKDVEEKGDELENGGERKTAMQNTHLKSIKGQKARGHVLFKSHECLCDGRVGRRDHPLDAILDNLTRALAAEASHML